MTDKTYTELLDLRKVNTIEDLLKRMSADAYEDSNGSYSDIPTWGPETERVRDLINASGPYGDIVSWDTTRADPVYLRRLGWETNGGWQHRFVLTHESDMVVS